MQKILFRGDIIHTVCPYYTIHCEYHWYISNVLITQSRSFEKTKQKILTDFEIQILFCSKKISSFFHRSLARDLTDKIIVQTRNHVHLVVIENR